MSVILAILAATILASSPVEQTFAAGETLDFNLHWMKISGGSARMTISPADEGKYRITSVAKNNPGFGRIYSFRDEIETTVDRADFSTLRYRKKLDEDGDQKEEITTVEEGVATRVRKKVKKVPVPRPVYDPISVIYYMRRLDLTPGKSYELTLVSDAKVYTVHARVVRRETVETPAGVFKTVMVEPEMESAGVIRDERLYIWYSDDERKLPVRIRTEVKFGAITATLRSIRSGVETIEPPVLRDK